MSGPGIFSSVRLPHRWLCACLLAAALAAFAQQPAAEKWHAVAQALGREGQEADGVYRVSFPRSDLRVRVGGVTLRPAFALTSWAAFQPAGDAAMVMGDLVLRSTEVSAVISRLVEGGVEVTAVHNHLMSESPQVVYVHYHGHGDAGALAATLRAALAATGTPLTTPRPRRETREPLAAGSDITQSTRDSVWLSEVAAILGHQGRVAATGVLQFGIPRAERITGGGAALGPRMGLGTVMNFQREGSGAVITGDFVLTGGEVQAVIRALRAHGIDVTALHNHMLDEEPRLFFLHFWGRGPSEQLARGLRAALDHTNHVRGS